MAAPRSTGRWAVRNARPKPTDSASSRRPSMSGPDGDRTTAGSPFTESAREPWMTASHAPVPEAPIMPHQPPAAASARYRLVASPRTWRMSSSYLRTTPRVSSTSSGASSRAPRDSKRSGPVERLGDARDLGQVGLAEAVDEADHLAGEALRSLGDAREDDLVLLLGGRVVDPVVEAPTLERVVDLAGPVRGEDDARRRLGPDRADLGDGDLEVGQDLEEIGLELLVGPVDLIDEEDRRDAVAGSRAPGGAAGGSGNRDRRCRGRSRGPPRRGPRAAGSRASGAGSSTRRRRC